MVDVEDRQFVEADGDQALQRLGGDLVAGFGEDFAGFRVEQILGDVLGVEILVHGLDEFHAALGERAGGAGRQLLAGFDDHVAGVGVDNVDGRLDALQALGVEGQAPAVLLALVDHLLVEGRQDLLAVIAQGVEQGGRGNLAAAVDARIDDVLGVEFDVEPGAAIGNDARREQQLAGAVALALVVIEEHAGRTVHLRDDDALGAIDDEGAVHGHEGHVAHIDILLLDVLDRFGAGVRVHIEHDQAQGHLERGGEGHAALAAFVHVIFRGLEFIFDEFEQGRAGKIRNREDRFEHGLQSLVGAPALGLLHHEELIVGSLLHFDQIGHDRDFADMTEEFADTLPAGERLRHVAPRTSNCRRVRKWTCRLPDLPGPRGKSRAKS